MRACKVGHWKTALAMPGIVLGLTACSGGGVSKHLVGQMVGGAAGAALGSTIGAGAGRAAAIAAGSILGAAAGGAVADDL